MLTNGDDLDFSNIGGNFTNLEYIDMEDGAANTITLTEADVLVATDAGNALIIVGETGDTVIDSGWEDTGKQVSIEGQTRTIYDNGLNDAEIIVSNDVTADVT